MKSRTIKITILLVLIGLLICAPFVSYCLGEKRSAEKEESTAYQSTDKGYLEQYLYEGKNVMVIVPHEDDELNLMAGILEQYQNAASDVRVVFVTNGDCKEKAETRIGEAQQAMRYYGILEENIIFLGYGDQWENGHIYNAPDDEIMTSCAGRTETYGTETKKPYCDRKYTRAGLKEDLKNIILEYEPDTLFCSDYDTHCDHRAVSLFFEEVMGEILKERPDYTPDVYKGFAYFQAWKGENDFYNDNIPSASYDGGDEIPYNTSYLWERRARFPVEAGSLARKLEDSRTYRALQFHASQNAADHAERIIKGDKIFWKRRTENSVLHGQIQVSSGNSSVLNDFKIVDSDQILEQDTIFDKGTWTADPEDMERSVKVIFAVPQTLSEIVLYDNPSDTDNILDAEISFSDGTILHSGALYSKGAGMELYFPQKEQITGFTVKILEAEGENAGLNEIEAYAQPEQSQPNLIKLTDPEGNFVYDYWTAESGRAELCLYVYEAGLRGRICSVDTESFLVKTKGFGCKAEIRDGSIYVTCKTGRRGKLMVTDKETGMLLDEIWISNPDKREREEIG